MKVFKKYDKNGKLIQTARIILLYGGSGYGFETSLFNSFSYSFNINMPIKRTMVEAEN